MKTKKRFHEAVKRSIVKAITFRCLIIVTNTIIVYLITRQASVTAGTMVFTSIASTVFYVIHERVWNGIHWGKSHQSGHV